MSLVPATPKCYTVTLLRLATTNMTRADLAALRALLTEALARVDALQAAEAARDTRQQQVDLLVAALAALDPHGHLSRWGAAQKLAALVQSRGLARAFGRRPSRDSERLIDEALALGPLPRSASRLWRLLPARQNIGSTLDPSPTSGGLWDD